MRSFEAVTGPKVDRWLVKSIGSLISVIGCSLLVGAREQPTPPSLKTLAVGSALALGTADVVYVAKGRISRVYLLDAVAELALLGLWAWEQSGTRARSSGDPEKDSPK